MTKTSPIDSHQGQTERAHWFSLFNVEDLLLLTCCRQKLTEANAEALKKLLWEPIDWGQVIYKARWHRLAGMLYFHLRQPDLAPIVPPQALEALKGDYRQITARYLYSRTELIGILAALEAQGIPVIVLKGAALVGTVYREPGMRPMSDIDLLVPEHRVEEAQSVVQGLGYCPSVDEANQEGHWSAHQHLPKLMQAERPVVAEVHRHIVRLDSPLVFDINEFWSRAQKTTFDGVSAYALSPEDLLLHLCLNFFRDRRFHSVRALCQLCDIAEVIRHYGPMDWDALVTRGKSYGVAGPLACSLGITRALLDAPVPAEVTRSLAPQMKEQDLMVFTRRRVATTRQWAASELVAPSEPYRGMSLIRAVVRRTVPTREYMRLHYGSAGLESYCRRFGQAVRVLARFARRPSELNEDLGVDRWMHSLYEGKPGWQPKAQG
jgi:hypothetical protein